MPFTNRGGEGPQRTDWLWLVKKEKLRLECYPCSYVTLIIAEHFTRMLLNLLTNRGVPFFLLPSRIGSTLEQNASLEMNSRYDAAVCTSSNLEGSCTGWLKRRGFVSFEHGGIRFFRRFCDIILSTYLGSFRGYYTTVRERFSNISVTLYIEHLFAVMVRQGIQQSFP